MPSATLVGTAAIALTVWCVACGGSPLATTNDFLDKAQQRGLTYGAGKAFEKFLNDRLGMKTVSYELIATEMEARDRARGR
jgi:hypothetical protein